MSMLLIELQRKQLVAGDSFVDEAVFGHKAYDSGRNQFANRFRHEVNEFSVQYVVCVTQCVPSNAAGGSSALRRTGGGIQPASLSCSG